MGVFSKNPQCKVPGNYQYVFPVQTVKKLPGFIICNGTLF